MKNGMQFQEAIRIMNCIELEDYIEIFGKEDGTYLWEKFVGHFGKRVDDFICYLDMGNIQLMFEYLNGRVGNLGPVEFPRPVEDAEGRN